MSEKKGVLLSHPTGNANVRELLRVLQELDALEAFHTTLGFSEESWLLKYSWPALCRTLKRRAYHIDPKRLHTNPIDEIFRIFKRRFIPQKNLQHNVEIDKLYYAHDTRVSKSLAHYPPRAVYAYEDGALQTFKVASNLGIQKLYELPIAYWETVHHLLDEEASRYPEWEGTLISTRDGVEKCKRKTEEINLADHIICPSEFVKRSIPSHILHKKNCAVLPYGAPLPKLLHSRNEPRKKGPIKILFVGSLSQRKGLADLFAAMRLLDPEKAHLTIIGTPILPLSFYKKQFAHFSYFPSMPHAAVLKLMQKQDILALPSIIEGRALVQLEALGSGLPVLITPNTGGDDMVRHGENGFLLPIRSPETIAETIEWLYTNRDQLPLFSKNARKTAEAYGWQSYRKLLAQFLKSVLN